MRRIKSFRPIRPLDKPKPTNEAGYDSKWQRLRRWILNGEPLCRPCSERGETTLAEDVHHIQKIRDRPDLRLDPANLMPICRPCHGRIHGAEKKGVRRT